MHQDDKIQLVQDSASNIWKVVREKTDSERFWSGLKISCICISLLLSVYSIILVRQFYHPIKEEKRDVFDIHEAIDPMNQWFMDVEPKLEKLIPQLNFPIVDCFRNKQWKVRGIVTYNGCFVDTSNGSMNIQSGVFTTAQQGIYQISFTAKYVASRQGTYGAWSDIYVNNKVIADSQREHNDESNDKETSTHTIMVFYLLQIGDEVKVKFHKDGSSYIHSDSDHDTHFTIRMISLPPIPRSTTLDFI